MWRSSHGWSLEGIEICDLSLTEQHLSADAQYTIFHPSEVELGETTQSLLAEVERVKPKFIVFDGLSEVAPAFPRSLCAIAASLWP